MFGVALGEGARRRKVEGRGVSAAEKELKVE